MKQKFIIFVALIFLVLLLVGLNAATYVQKEKIPDTEVAPNRSTYNYGSTGSNAFYTLLSETGRNVRRWQEPIDDLTSSSTEKPAVFVIIGPLRRELSDSESTNLMEWVAAGGTLVLIDRDPIKSLALTTAQWQMSVTPGASLDLVGIDSTDQRQMTTDTPAIKPSLPSAFTHGVNSVQPSRFASTVAIERFAGAPSTVKAGLYTLNQGNTGGPPPPPPPRPVASPTPIDFYAGAQSPTPVPSPTDESYDDDDYETDDSGELIDRSATFEAPVVHVGDSTRKILVEAPFSLGRVVILTDPYMVSNAGLNVVDNSRLAINVVTARKGPIVFDEYHHGYGANNNRFLDYFSGTPVISIFLQIVIIIAAVFFSQSRRFARPVPEPEPNRLSKLEYVSAMAELQQRTRAYDLAIENIYSDFRRRVCSLLGLDNTTATKREIAGRIAERISAEPAAIEQLLHDSEDVVHGEPISRKDTIQLVERIRELEARLGLKRSRGKGV